MILPTITLGGTSADALGQQALNVREKAEDLIQALREAAPHGRDYFDAYPAARAAWERRLEAVNEMLEYYLSVAEAAVDYSAR